MTTTEFLAAIVQRLDASEIPHMVAGSVASSHHGEPRSTQDIDLVIDPSRAQLVRFVELFEPNRFYVNDALAALDRRDLFNVIEPSTGFKADLMIRKDRPFSRAEVARRESVEIVGVMTAVATAEDTILAKLEWGQTNESARQLRDVAAMISVHALGLDVAYLRRRAAELGVLERLDEMLGLDDDNNNP